MARESWLSKGGGNLFQEIKAICAEAEAVGKEFCRLSIGQPVGPAFWQARAEAARAVMSDNEEMHEYQDNGSLGVPKFAERFVNCHVKTNILAADVKCLPIPGIKPMLQLIPFACGLNGTNGSVLTMTKPGYPTPATWLARLNIKYTEAELSPENKFRFDPAELFDSHKLVMANFPHNPSGQIATQEYWTEICKIAAKFGIRLFNDGAYSIITHTPDHCTLADVAINFPNLSWAEGFSASKAGNFTGWRVGAIVGSPDFVDDIAKIKGDVDSGFVAPVAAGILHTFEKHMHLIQEIQKVYQARISILIDILTKYGMQLAVKPQAGFFTLWKTPKSAFGQKIKDAKDFNFKMIQETGVVGVHFNPFMRYAVCGDIESMTEQIEDGFKKARISY